MTRFLEALGVAALLGTLVVVVTTHVRHAHVRRYAGATLRKRWTWLIGIPMVALIVLVGAPFGYVQFTKGPAARPLTFADLAPSAGVPASTAQAASATAPTDATTTAVGPTSTVAPTRALTNAASAPASPIAGHWRVGSGTQAGYSIDDNAMGMKTRVVGRTQIVSGTAQIVDTTVTGVEVVVDMASVLCHCQHDAKYRDLLEVGKYPTSTFTLTRPMPVAVPPPNTVVTMPVTGNFTIHGVTRSVTFTLKATRIGNRVAVNGSIPVNFQDYNIHPSNSALANVSNCDIDLLIAFDHVA